MNCLHQLPSGIFSTEEDLKALAEKKSASILVYSDSHGDYEAVSDIIMKFGGQSDALIFSGDGISDLLCFMEKAASYDDAMKCLPSVIAFVRGNNDYSFEETSFLQKTAVPLKVTVEAAGRKILVTHGHQECVYTSPVMLERAAEISGCDTVIYGHSHAAGETRHEIYSINPGSITYPRGNGKRSFAVLNLSRESVKASFYEIHTGCGTEFVPYQADELFD